MIIDRIVVGMLRKAGIQATQHEIDDFVKRLTKYLWDKMAQQRKNEASLTEKLVEAADLSLPNGMVGKEYTAEKAFDVPGVEEYELEGLEAVGLTYEKTDKGFTIHGLPSTEDGKCGDHTITLRYKPQCLLDNDEWLERKLTLVLNPDPKTLWKNIPTPRDTEYFKEDCQMSYVKVEAKDGMPRKDIVAASQRGRSHAHEGKPRDDDFRLCFCEKSEWYVIAVADGAGSAKYSREGSRIACETAVDHCKETLANSADFENAIRHYNESPDDSAKKQVGDCVYTIIGNAALKAHKAIQEEAERHQSERQDNTRLKDYATTLLLAICKKFDFGWAVASFWVGDGAMCIYNSEKHTADLLGTPDGGEYAGQTRFLTMPEIFKDRESFYRRLRFKIYSDFTALMLMTDGVSDPKFETDANLSDPAKWDALWNDLKENNVELTDDNEMSKEQLLEWLNIYDQGNHDDRTIAILY